MQALNLPLEMESALVGGAAYAAHGHPLPESTLKLAMNSDAVLLGGVAVRLQALRQQLGGVELQQLRGVVVDTDNGVEKGHGWLRGLKV